MAKITAGNRLYLYRLLSRELGVGKQSRVTLVDEVLSSDGLCPEDLGCADARELCEQLAEFVKLTVFKKGYVYATVLANEEYDRALERLANGSGEKSAGKAPARGKPWKHKGGKMLKPVKPRHIERAAETEAATESAPAGAEVPAAPAGARASVEAEAPAEMAAPAGAEAPNETPVAQEPEETAPAGAETPSEPSDVPEPADAASGEAAPAVPETEAAPAPTAVPEAVPEPAVEPEAVPEPAVEPAPATEPEAVSEPTVNPAPEPTPEPTISLTITYDPYADVPDAPEDATSFSPAPQPAEPVAAPAPERIQSDLPQDFHADVRCSCEQLSILYQVLPADVDPMATLEEDFRVARSTGALEGTRSNVSFPLRFLRADGTGPVRVTLRRSARAVAGKRWALVEVDAGEPDEVGLEGLSEAPCGPWAAFLHGSARGEEADPGRSFTQTIALGSWDEVLEQLASLSAPEDWGAGHHVLRDYLTMTFARIQATGMLSVSEDGDRAGFDTGLIDTDGAPIHATLTKRSGDIPWELEGFSTDGLGAAPRYVTDLAQVTLDPSLPAPALPSADAVARSPRLATAAYDPVHDRVLLLVPDGDEATALLATPAGYEVVAALPLSDAYACARVVSAEQPAWLASHVDG